MSEPTIGEQLQEVAENICDNFCKYSGTGDADGTCQWTDEGNDCPLDKLT